MTDDNKIIQGLWIGGALSVIEQLCIKSFVANGHSFHLYTYGPVQNVPNESIVEDANSIIPQEKIFHDSRGGVAAFSDLFRYELLRQKGGWWVDLDIFCLRPLDIITPYAFATETKPEGAIDIASCVIKMPKDAPIANLCAQDIWQRLSEIKDNAKYLKWHDKNGHSLVDKVRRFIARNFIKNDTEIIWGEFGPWFLGERVRRFDNLKQYIAAPDTFCPIPFFECYKLISHQEQNIISENAYTIHYWNEMFNIIKLNKNAIYNENSIVEQLKRKYHVMPQL